MSILALDHPLTRRSVEDAIERLVAMLDEFDGDPDFEMDVDDEASIGWTERGPSSPPISDQSAHHASNLAGVDLEQDDTDFEDGYDLEPTLGAPERHPHSVEYVAFGVLEPRTGLLRHWPGKSQDQWADGAKGDHEREEENEHGGDVLDDPHDAADSGDDEPELGSTEHINQELAGPASDDGLNGWGRIDGGEPSLGWCGHGRGCTDDEPRDDREGDDEREPDGDDSEPSLGWNITNENRPSVYGCSDDREDNGDETDTDGSEHDYPGFIAGGNEGGDVQP